MTGHDNPYGAGEPQDPGDPGGPPRIRVTGEVPAVTGEPASPWPTADDRPFDLSLPAETADIVVPVAGSVVDRPAPPPPDWMSGVQVPELLVTREIDRGEIVPPRGPTLGQAVQRVAGLVLVAVLVAVVVLVVVGSATGLGSGLR